MQRPWVRDEALCWGSSRLALSEALRDGTSGPGDRSLRVVGLCVSFQVKLMPPEGFAWTSNMT